MRVYLVGNLLVADDNLPLKLLPKLRREFPDAEFVEADPNENFIPEDNSVIIDTVKGIKNIRWFEDLNDFVTTRSVSPHDYDLGLHLQLLRKLKKITNIRILGIPRSNNLKQLLREIVKELHGKIIIMDVAKIIKELERKYPGKTIVKNLVESPTEIICEIDPTSRHPDRSTAIAVVGLSKPHYHNEATETYEVLRGKLKVKVSNQEFLLTVGEKIIIKPKVIHSVRGDETWFRVKSRPGWRITDHILVNST